MGKWSVSLMVEKQDVGAMETLPVIMNVHRHWRPLPPPPPSQYEQ